MLKKLLIIFIAGLLIWGITATPTSLGTTPALADEEGTDYGYWCTTCGRQHGPGESCPGSSQPSYSEPEPYDWSQPTYAPVTTTTDTSTTTVAETSTTTSTSTTITLSDRQKGLTHSRKLKDVTIPGATSVVDPKDKRGAALTINPSAVQGGNYRPKIKPAAAPPAPGDRAVIPPLSDKQMWDLIADMQLNSGKQKIWTGKKRIFERNPNPYLTNPLWTREKRAVLAMQAMDADREFIAARKKYVAEADQAIYKEQVRLLEDVSVALGVVKEKDGLLDFTAFHKKWRTDPAFRREAQAIWDNYQDRSIEIAIKYNGILGDKMAEETKKFYQRHPNLKPGN